LVHECAAIHLPCNFLKENDDDKDDRFHICPIMNPPHSHDFSQLRDAVYNRTAVLHHYNVLNEENKDQDPVIIGSTNIGTRSPRVGDVFARPSTHASTPTSSSLATQVTVKNHFQAT